MNVDSTATKLLLPLPRMPLACARRQQQEPVAGRASGPAAKSKAPSKAKPRALASVELAEVGALPATAGIM